MTNTSPAPEQAQPDYEAFGRAVWRTIRNTEFFFSNELSEDIMPLAVDAGLAKRVEYDPNIHSNCQDCEKGDMIWYMVVPADVDPRELAEKVLERAKRFDAQWLCTYGKASIWVNLVREIPLRWTAYEINSGDILEVIERYLGYGATWPELGD